MCAQPAHRQNQIEHAVSNPLPICSGIRIALVDAKLYSFLLLEAS
jgi:hypothetical protein